MNRAADRDEGAEAEAEEEKIDIAAFYDEFIRSGRGNATVIAEAERPAAKARMTRLLGDIERDHHAQHRKEADAERVGSILTYHNSRCGGAQRN